MIRKWMNGRHVSGLLPVLSVCLLAACDGILDVELPGQITEDALYRPEQAPALVLSAMADIECAYSDFIATNGGGNDDVFVRTTGWWGGTHEFQLAPGMAECNEAENSYGWWTPLQKGRYQAERTYDAITGWDVEDKEQLLAQAALYAGVAYELLGEHFCELAVDEGPLLSAEQVLQEAEDWYTAALQHIGGSDFALPGGIATSAEQTAYLLRARTRLAQNDLEGAQADAEQVTEGFMAWVTRESGGERTRWNRVVNSHNGSNWNSVLGPVTWWDGPGDWPDVIPFTGYRDLGILPDGRAITTTQHPVTVASAAGAVPDSRVPVVDGEKLVNNYPLWLQQKYQSLDDDMALANWEEAWLIRAEAEGGQAAIDLVNEIRDFHDLPRVTYLSADDAQGIHDMIIEERRRSLFLEGRFWSTKIRERLWFPRGVGTTPYPYSYQTGVRMVMPTAAYELNPNFGEELRGTGCSAEERPAL